MLKPLFLTLLVIVIAMAIVTTSFAELPPGSYDKMRVDADSAVTILVTSLKATDAHDGKEVVFEAKVLGVERSKSGIKKGDSIKVGYFARDPGKPIAGPRPIPILERDSVHPAFLERDAHPGVYKPAAHGESFKMTPEDRR